MKASEFRKLIREEIRKVMKEATSPVESFVEDIMDIAGSGAGETSGLEAPEGKHQLMDIIKNIKAQNLMIQVDAALVKYINTAEKGAFTMEDVEALQAAGFRMKGIEPSQLEYDDDDFDY